MDKDQVEMVCIESQVDSNGLTLQGVENDIGVGELEKNKVEDEDKVKEDKEMEEDKDEV